MREALHPYYWRFQILGWGFFCVLGQIYTLFIFDSAVGYFLIDMVMQWFSLVVVSHLIVVWSDRQRWLRFSGWMLWARVLVACFIGGLLCGVPSLLAIYSLQSWLPAELRNVLDVIITSNIALRVFSSATQFGIKLMLWYLVVWMIYQQQAGARLTAQQQTMNLELQSTRLENLRQQLKPHFLFNCLNSIRAMIHINKDKASEMVGELTDILRYALQAPGDRVAMSEELRVVDSYLSLEKARLGERLQIEKQIDPAALDILLPSLLLQTLVENAIRHGISQLARGGTLKLEANRDSSGVTIVVRNDGSLNSTAGGFGVGLKNGRQRLKLLYGRDDLLQVVGEGGQVVSTLLIPAQAEHPVAHG